MLKIKDNVDLKELEKFGFKYYKNRQLERYETDDGTDVGDYLMVIIEKRRLVGNYLEKVYDLIKADMVEKVEV